MHHDHRVGGLGEIERLRLRQRPGRYQEVITGAVDIGDQHAVFEYLDLERGQMELVHLFGIEFELNERAIGEQVGLVFESPAPDRAALFREQHVDALAGALKIVLDIGTGRKRRVKYARSKRGLQYKELRRH